MAVTPKNNNKKIRLTKHIPSSRNTTVKTTSSTNPQGNNKNDRIQRAPSKAKKNKLEDHHKIVRPSLDNKKNVVDTKAISSVTNSQLNVNVDLKCATCNGCLFSDNHDACVLTYINSVNASLKSKSVKKPVNRKFWQPTGKMFTTVGHVWKPTRWNFTLVGNVSPLTRIATTAIVPLREPIPIESNTDKHAVTLVVQIILWYLDSGCSKHMTKDRSQLINFVQKFLGTVKFGNDHVAKIMGYGYDPLALESKFTPVEESICVLETTFVEDVVLTVVFLDDGICLVNLIFLLLFFGVTAISLVPNFGSMGCKDKASVTTALPLSLLKLSLRAVITKTFS
uniref:Integrase, catalytic region, zinc finger, CCHC-type, peptidase aspartic, catalytic n=1 Tax=Tanacetum cinerariifolium TaxID=118510 RepID=A0A699HWA1_TANCI|nr:integrase, catalytic region, zinc finger, CCHC-type, peptidase aspartic, catalytic [Tanacetum cinerariifolium]